VPERQARSQLPPVSGELGGELVVSRVPLLASCLPPPEEHEEELFALIGDPGAKNGACVRATAPEPSLGSSPYPPGEKKLRAMLTARPEWVDGASREALASQCDALSCPVHCELSTALRSRNTSLLRKRHLFALARTLRVRCDIWKRRDGLPPARAVKARPNPFARVGSGSDDEQSLDAFPGTFRRQAAPCDAALSASSISPAAVSAYVSTVLAPLSRAACRMLSGPRARAEAEACGAPHITAAGVVLSRRAAALLAGLGGAFKADGITLRTWQAQLEEAPREAASRETAASQPAWRTRAGRPSLASKACVSVGAVIAAALQTNAADKETLLRMHESLTSADVVWFEEIEAACMNAMELTARVEALVGQLSFCSFDTYLPCAALLLDVLADHLRGAAAAQIARAEWMEAVVHARSEAREPGGAAQEAAAAQRALQAYGERSFGALLAHAAEANPGLLPSHATPHEPL